MKVYFIENKDNVVKQLTTRQITAMKNKWIKSVMYTWSPMWYVVLYNYGQFNRFYISYGTTITSVMSQWRKRTGTLDTISVAWTSWEQAATNLLSFAKSKYASQDDLNADI